MKTSFILKAFVIAILSGLLSLSAPVFGGNTSTDLLHQAFDLVHQAANPGGDPPPNDQRTDLLSQALKLLADVPDHHLRGHRVEAMRDINAALALIKNGDPDNKASDAIREALSELRTSLSIAE